MYVHCMYPPNASNQCCPWVRLLNPRPVSNCIQPGLCFPRSPMAGLFALCCTSACDETFRNFQWAIYGGKSGFRLPLSAIPMRDPPQLDKVVMGVANVGVTEDIFQKSYEAICWPLVQLETFHQWMASFWFAFAHPSLCPRLKTVAPFCNLQRTWTLNKFLQKLGHSNPE